MQKSNLRRPGLEPKTIGGLGLPLLDWLEQCALPEESKLADQAYARAVAAEFLDGLVLQGGADVCAEAATHLAGGHSVDDPEPKYGMAVTGFVHPDEVWTNAGGRAGRGAAGAPRRSHPAHAAAQGRSQLSH